MNISTLEKFVVLSKHLNYTAAARELHISQPGLSKAISEMERELGVELFTRKNGVELTSAGAYFREKAEDILYAYRDAVKGAKDIAREGDASLTIAFPYTMDAGYVAIMKACDRLRAAHPYAHIRFAEQDKTPFIDKLDAGTVDTGKLILFQSGLTSFSYDATHRVRLVEMCGDQPELWLPLDCEFGQDGVVSLADLEKIPLMVTSAPPFETFQVTLENFMARYGVTLRLHAIEANSREDFSIQSERRGLGMLLGSTGVGKEMGYLVPRKMRRVRIDSVSASYHYLAMREDDDNPLLDEFVDDACAQHE
jgi:DNA-binding transcriptional LysR family regulator